MSFLLNREISEIDNDSPFCGAVGDILPGGRSF